MVRLPHRADGLGDQLALPFSAGAEREEVPHAAAEIGAPQHRVGVERDENDSCEPIGERHDPPPDM